MPTVLTGLVDDSDILSNERVIDMSDVIDILESDVTQFTTALSKANSKPANSTKVEWLEDQLMTRITTLAASATSAATSLSCNDGTIFNVNDVVRIPVSGEAVVVTGITSNEIGVTRSVGTVAAATAASGVDLIVIGNAYNQGATLQNAKVLKRSNQYNYTQIFRHPYSFTRSLTQSKLYGGPEPMKERKKKAIEHKRAIEYMLFFGARELLTGGSEPQGFSGGLVEFLSTNLHDASGTLSATELDTYLQTDLQHGSTSKVMFASPTVARVISTFARDNWTRTGQSNSLWGVKVDGLVSGAYGYEVPVFVKKDWNDFSATSTQYGSWAFVVDMEAVTLRPLQNTILLRNRQANDADRVTEEYLTEVSLEVRSEKKHAIVKGVTA